MIVDAVVPQPVEGAGSGPVNVQVRFLPTVLCACRPRGGMADVVGLSPAVGDGVLVRVQPGVFLLVLKPLTSSLKPDPHPARYPNRQRTPAQTRCVVGSTPTRAIDFFIALCGGNGRRAELRFRWPQGREGSTPSGATCLMMFHGERGESKRRRAPIGRGARPRSWWLEVRILPTTLVLIGTVAQLGEHPVCTRKVGVRFPAAPFCIETCTQTLSNQKGGLPWLRRCRMTCWC